MIDELVAGPIEPDDAFESWFDEAVPLIATKKLTRSNLVQSSSFVDEFHTESTYQVAKIDRLRKVS